MSNRPWWRRMQLDIIEVLVIVGFVGVCIWALGNHGIRWYRLSSEANALAQRYGTARYSYGIEEIIIRDFFKDRRGGFFVDVGAGDWRYDSNTYYLEERLGWSGIAVDALASYGPGYARHRPRTEFFARFVSDVSGRTATVFAPRDTRMTAEARRPEHGTAREVHVATVTLTDLLTQRGISRVDLLSVDVEMAEPRVLAGFDIVRFHPELVCIEAFAPVRQQILDYFARHRYVVVAPYLYADDRNLYFRPLSSPE